MPFIVDDASAFAAAMELSDNKQVSASISNMSEHQLDVTSQILTAYNVSMRILVTTFVNCSSRLLMWIYSPLCP